MSFPAPKNPFGSGGYGVSYTKGNKGQPPLAQIDPSAALAYFAQGGQQGAQGFIAGNSFYQAALDNASKELVAGYKNANRELQPLVGASRQALTLFQQMMGITPESTTHNYDRDLLEIDPNLTKIAGLIKQANSATSIEERSKLRTQITEGLKATGQANINIANKYLTGLVKPSAINYVAPQVNSELLALQVPPAMRRGGGELPGNRVMGDPINGFHLQFDSSPTYMRNRYSIGGIQQQAALMDAQGANLQGFGVDKRTGQQAYGTKAEEDFVRDMKLYEGQVGAGNTALANAQAYKAKLQAFADRFNMEYTPEKAVGFTGDQVEAHVASTPGYKFNLNQGAEQILRNQAAIGNLGNGQTRVALTKFGQDYAQNAYGGYMDNLQRIINNGLPSIQQLAANKANEGGYLSNIQQKKGEVGYNAAVGAGNAQQQASNNQGQVAYNTAAANVQHQNNAWMKNQDAKNAQSAQAMNLANQAMTQAAENDSGAGYYQGMQSLAPNQYVSYGNTFTDYTKPISNGGAI